MKGSFPDSKHMAGGEMVGLSASGFITKKGAPTGEMGFNVLPPGDMIDQPDADIREMPMKSVTSIGYPGDGWD